MYCPVCRAEYRSGFTTCSDCMVDLVDPLPEEGAPNPGAGRPFVGTDPVNVYETGDPFRAELIRSFLLGHDIDAEIFGPGDPRIAGYRIMVHREDGDEARRLVVSADRGDFAVSERDVDDAATEAP